MSEQLVKNGDITLWTVAEGEGTTLLLCNGGPGCSDYLGDVAAMVSDQVRVIRWEQRGCGRSTGKEPFTLQQTFADMEAIREHYGVDQWLVGGHSWGADLAVMYALEHPQRVTALICLAGGRMNDNRDWHAAYKAARAERGETEPSYPYPPNMTVNEQLNAERQRYIQEPYLWHDLARLTQPALFVYGSDDIRPDWAAEQVAHLLPQGQFMELSGAGHALWLSHHYGLSAALRKYIGGLVQVGTP